MSLRIILLSLGLLTGELSPSTSATAPEVDAVAERALASLPGNVGFVFAELTDGGPKLLFGLNEDDRFAIGSSFKLFILGTLAKEVNADRRQLANSMVLRPDWVGPPHSEMAQWPMGSPVTLNTLALKMISISDNTATDHLIHLLGRKAIELQMTKMGHGHPEWNRPLLSTRQMTMLRDKNTGLLGKDYRTLNESARRKFLAAKTVGEPDYEQLDFDTAAYNLAEWYATPMDMAHAMAWLRRETEGDRPAHPLRAILAIDPKLPHDNDTWPYVGFKGGSEDQLLAGNWLLQHRDGRWFTFHVFCNSPHEEVNPEQMIAATGQIFAAIEQAVEETNGKR